LSGYGDLWEDLRAVREQLGKLMPAVDTNSYAAARKSATAIASRVEELMTRWAAIQVEMEKQDD
jgi:hypothetical protein